ncbi:MAG TPA: hypothetical protein VJ958_00470 [Atribacterota bacterium]|nr:hypothetical protein [Atribacterota bacterium]
MVLEKLTIIKGAIAIKLDMNLIMSKLKSKRQIFHSEADFQFALAWEIQREYPEVEVRLEYAYKIGDKLYHIDILVINENQYIPIELKYKTLKKSVIFESEEFHLKNHGAQDLGKYDLLKDVVRVEKVLQDHNKFVDGHVIMLTNDPSYWKKESKENTCCADFSIADARVVTGNMAWAKHTGAGTMKNREEPIALMGTYNLKWYDFSKFDEKRNGQFRYLLIDVEIKPLFFNTPKTE